jgi:hypothetical protein
MQAFGNSFSTREVLIPLLMAVTVFLAFLGMQTPDLPRSQTPKGHHRAVVENQIKEVKTGIENSGQVFELCHSIDLVEPTLYHVSPPHRSYIRNIYNIGPLIPSRAPPAFQA